MQAPTRPHVLYAVSHDLRHDISSSALDAIAADGGCRFQLAFSQAPYCAPSRNSFFTGRRTTTTNVHTFSAQDARAFAPIMRQRTHGPHSPLTPRPPWTALPQAFADAGYATYGAGITVESFRDSAARCPGCWTDGYYLDWPQSPDPATFDAVVADAGSAWLRAWHNRTTATPFFLMVGFHGGHKPWPLEPAIHQALHTDFYTLEQSDLQLWRKPYATGRMTSLEQTAGELRGTWREESGERTVGEFEQIRRGYLVNEQRFDAALSSLLGTLRSIGAWERTVVVFHGDHGLSLGEYGVAGKGKLLDVDTRVPLLIRAPYLRHRRPPSLSGGGGGGQATCEVHDRVVELVDVYPTLCDLAAIPCPPRAARAARSGDETRGGTAGAITNSSSSPLGTSSIGSSGSTHPNGVAGPVFESAPPLDGNSLLPLLEGSEDAAVGGDDDDRGLAISTYPRCAPSPPHHSLSCNGLRAENISIMGTSVRTHTWRLVVWTAWGPSTRRPVFQGLVQHARRAEIELYYVAPTSLKTGLSASSASDTDPSDIEDAPPRLTLLRRHGPKDLGVEQVNLAARFASPEFASELGPEAELRMASQLPVEIDEAMHATAVQVGPSVDLWATCERLYAHAIAAWPDASPPPSPPPPSLPPSPPLCADAERTSWCMERVGAHKCNVSYVATRCMRSCALCAYGASSTGNVSATPSADPVSSRLRSPPPPLEVALVDDGQQHLVRPSRPPLPSTPQALLPPPASSPFMPSTFDEMSRSTADVRSLPLVPTSQSVYEGKAEVYALVGVIMSVAMLFAFCYWGRAEAVMILRDAPHERPSAAPSTAPRCKELKNVVSF